jgi:uncharacterized protein (DUF885 family)
MRQVLHIASVKACVLVFALCANATNGPNDSLTQLFTQFITEYKDLKVPEFDYSYVENFKNIPDIGEIQKQATFFGRYKKSLGQIDRKALDTDLRYQYDALVLEVDFNLERVDLERRFRESGSDQPIPIDGLFRLPDSPRWYALYIRRWTSTALKPGEIFDFSMSEAKRVAGEYRALQAKAGFAGRDEDFYAHLGSSAFVISDQAELVDAIYRTRDRAQANLKRIFEDDAIPVIRIKPIPSPTKDSPPGYYDDGTYYYNFYQERFPKRALEWLYMHEAVPGHHYQRSIGEKNRPPISKLFWYPGFSEGWAAYIETLGGELGFYQDPYMHLGKWEWDLVRSVRLAIDVGIHSQGWSRAQALEFWRKHVFNQETIAEREVDRIIRWPVQVMSYKLGERAFNEMRQTCQLSHGSRFDIRRFHSIVLKRGSIPLPVVKQVVSDECI